MLGNIGETTLGDITLSLFHQSCVFVHYFSSTKSYYKFLGGGDSRGQISFAHRSEYVFHSSIVQPLSPDDTERFTPQSKNRENTKFLQTHTMLLTRNDTQINPIYNSSCIESSSSSSPVGGASPAPP